jgi:hypothetical protein
MRAAAAATSEWSTVATSGGRVCAGWPRGEEASTREEQRRERTEAMRAASGPQDVSLEMRRALVSRAAARDTPGSAETADRDTTQSATK